MVVTVVVLASTLFVLVVLLAMPVRFDLQVERTGETRASWQLHALLGLVHVSSGSDRTPSEPRKAARDGRRRRASRKRGVAHVVAMLRTPGFLPRVIRLLRQLAGRVRWSRCHLHAQFGLDDPADTGRLFAVIGPLTGLAAWRGWDVSIQPSFPDAYLSGSCAASASVRPLAVLGVVLAFIGSPSVWRAIRRLRSG